MRNCRLRSFKVSSAPTSAYEHVCEWAWSFYRLPTRLLLLLQELVEDVAVATSSRHADLSWARRFAVASPRFIGRRSASAVLSQDCLGRPALRLQSPGESIMQASRARWWSCQGSARRRCPKNDRQTVLLKHVKVKLSPQAHERNHFRHSLELKW